MKVTEEVGGPFGFTVEYTLGENELYVDFAAFEIAGRTVDGTENGVPLYLAKEWKTSGDQVETTAESDRFIYGSVKWDGCGHWYFSDADGYRHLCGGRDVAQFAALLRTIFLKCGEMMGHRVIEGEFDPKAFEPDTETR